MIDDRIDVDVYPSRKGWNVVVSYWYYDRSKKRDLALQLHIPGLRIAWK